MDLFIKKTLIFSFILCTFFTVNYFVNSFLFNRIIGNYEIKNSTLVTGDSHMVRAINPDYFNDVSNISQNSEPLFISYWKIK